MFRALIWVISILGYLGVGCQVARWIWQHYYDEGRHNYKEPAELIIIALAWPLASLVVALYFMHKMMLAYITRNSSYAPSDETVEWESIKVPSPVSSPPAPPPRTGHYVRYDAQ